MKKILLSFIAALFGFTLFAGTIDAPATISIQEMIMPDDYCPPGYICVATNKTAYGPNYGNGAKTIKGISVYRNDDKYVAYYPVTDIWNYFLNGKQGTILLIPVMKSISLPFELTNF